MQRSAICAAVGAWSLIICLACGEKPNQTAALRSEDFPGIQAALDALPAEGGVVRVAPGIHRITQPLRIRRSNVALSGEGRATIIYNANRQGEPAIIARAGEDPENNPLWGVTVSNMCITGDSSSSAGASAWPEENHPLLRGGDGILADHCYNSLFEKLWLVRNGGCGLNLYVCYEDPRIQSCVIVYNRKAGIRLEGCHDIVVSANEIEENYQEGILAVGCYNLTASGNDIDDQRGPGVVLQETTCSTMSGNLIEESRGWGLIFQDSPNNTFSSGSIRNNRPGGGARLISSSFNVISGCAFEVNGGPEIFIDQASRQNNITGNTFSVERFQGEVPSSQGLFIGGRENLVSANIVSPSEGVGMVVSGESQNVFGNTVISREGEACILVENLSNSIVRDNLLLNRAGGGQIPGRVAVGGSNSGNLIEGNR